MKKTLAILIFLAAAILPAPAQFSFPDLTTPRTNTVSSSGFLTVASAGITNSPYFAYNFTNISYGDSAFSAWLARRGGWLS